MSNECQDNKGLGARAGIMSIRSGLGSTPTANSNANITVLSVLNKNVSFICSEAKLKK